MNRLLFIFFVTMAALASMVDRSQAQTEQGVMVPPPQNAVWFEQRVGHVVVSRTNSDQHAALAYVFYLAAIGPRPATANKDYGSCLKAAVRSAGLSFIDVLDNEARLFVPDVEPIYSEPQVNRTQIALITARGEYRRQIVQSCKEANQDDNLRKYIDGTRIALIKRECTQSICPGLDAPQAVDIGAQLSEGERRERVFEAIYYWALRKRVDVPLNQAILLDFSDTGGLAARPIEARPGLAWPLPLQADEVQSLFEEGVMQVLRSDAVPPLSPVIASQISLPRATVLRTAYAYRNGQEAWTLGRDTPELKLRSLQDEVARIQLAECSIYRGTHSAIDVAKCAGYTVDESSILECLNGGPCMPNFAPDAQIGSLLLSARRGVDELAVDAFIPRPYSEAPGSFKSLVETYKACSIEITDADDASACLARRLIDPTISQQANCLLDATQPDRIACLAPNPSVGRSLEHLSKCLDHDNEGCIAAVALPPQWACVAGAQSVSDLGCLTPSFGGEGARLAQCLSDTSDIQSRILCIGGDNIPPEVKSLVNCYSSSSTEAGVAVCALGTGLPPEQAAILKCAAESGGDPLAAGVCVASPYLGLNAGQQIILQCAAASGGVPATAAACIVGRFTLAELQGCESAEFGESGCFGDGNEFQKLAVALTSSKISKDSVVGHIAIFYIKRANKVIQGVGHALKEVGKGFDNLTKGVDHELDKIQNDPLQAVADAPGNIIREGGKVLENVGKALDFTKLSI